AGRDFAKLVFGEEPDVHLFSIKKDTDNPQRIALDRLDNQNVKNEAQIIYYDLLPDYTVSVLLKGCDEWDLLKSMSHLESWASSQ
ncbi:hypothetical protein HJ177_24545, partial [Vibrio parahaemolyticus]|nr:hypothetical protein [Vibrio parahaemolyticus]